MAAPMMMMRAVWLQKLILLYRNNFIKLDQLNKTACNRYSNRSILSRYSSTEANDTSVKLSSTSENQENDNLDFNDADDIFGILENRNISDPPSEETIDMVSYVPDDKMSPEPKQNNILVRPEVVLGKEKVLDVRFGYIRKDSDNPAVAVRKRGNRREDPPLEIDDPLVNKLADTFESPDFVSRLFSPGHSHLNPINTNIVHKIRPTGNEIKEKPDNYVFSSHVPSFSSSNEDKSRSENESNYCSNYIDEQYFDSDTVKVHDHLDKTKEKITNNFKTENNDESDGRNLNDISQIDNDEKDLNYFDTVYFGSNSSSTTSNEDLSKENGLQDIPISKVLDRKETNGNALESCAGLKEDDINIFDEQYFEESSTKLTVEKSTEDMLREDIEHLTDSVIGESVNADMETILSKNDKMDLSSQNTLEMSVSTSEKPGDIIVQTVTKQSKRLESRVQPNLENPETAYDVAMKYRLDPSGKLSEKQQKESGETVVSTGKVDSKGYRILKDQVPDWSYTPQEVLAKVLRDSILYDKDDIIAIDKPYGLPSHGGPGVRVSIGQLTPFLAKLLDKTGNLKKLHLIHRLDKETTGVMLLAKSAEMAWKLRGLFKRQEVVKTYWLITKGIPNPAEGIIDIPLRETSGQAIHKMCLQPDNSKGLPPLFNRRSTLKSRSAVTHYRILDSQSECALVECQPETGVKHQIRVHMAHGLNTPILGDHKYSHFNKLAPQKLHPEILTRLGIRQSKVRHVAMHLHAKTIVLPEFMDGRNLILSARLPRHFTTNMKRLKLKPSD